MDFPDTWRQCLLKDICLPTKQWNPSKEKRERFTYIDVSAVSRESCTIQQPRLVNEKEAPSRARKIVSAGDSVYATVRPTLRRIAFIERDYENQIVSTAFCVLRPNTREAAPRFIYFLLRTDFVNDAITKHESGASYPAVNDKHVLNCQIPLPPKPEQEKIAAVLWKVQRAITTQDRLIAATRDLKASAMQQLFTHGLHNEPLKDTEIGPMPESWKLDSLANRCHKPEYGVTASAKDQPIGPRFLRITDITENGVNWNNVPYCACSDEDYKKKRLEHDDIVFARIGATTGKSFIVKNPPNSVFASYLIRVRPQNDLNADYLYYYFDTESYWQHINANKDNNMKGGVNGSVLSQLLIPIPPIDEQRVIAAVFATIDRKLAYHQKKRTALNDLFQSLLHKLMTAVIRVNHLDIDTSEIAQPSAQGVAT